MKRIIIICEGVSEQNFCREILFPHFLNKETIIEYPQIKHSSGGIVHWEVLKKQIEGHLKAEKAVFVSTFIDFYGIKDSHDFPLWMIEKKTTEKKTRLYNLEKAMQNDIDVTIAHRFVPYLQLHEFEGLLFSDMKAFENAFSSDFADFQAIEAIINNFPNPEDINDHPITAPSKRLEQYITGYRKTLHGEVLALELGLEKIRSKCPRFNQWITILETLNEKNL